MPRVAEHILVKVNIRPRPQAILSSCSVKQGSTWKHLDKKETQYSISSSNIRHGEFDFERQPTMIYRWWEYYEDPQLRR